MDGGETMLLWLETFLRSSASFENVCGASRERERERERGSTLVLQLIIKRNNPMPQKQLQLRAYRKHILSTENITSER